MDQLPDTYMTEEARKSLRRLLDQHLAIVKTKTAAGASHLEALIYADRIVKIDAFVGAQVNLTADL